MCRGRMHHQTKRIMKTTKALVLSFLFLLGAASVRAQATDRTDRPDPSERAENQAERMAIVLDLTPAQTARVREINQSFAERVKGEREEGRNQRQALQQERTADVEDRSHRGAILQIGSPPGPAQGAPERSRRRAQGERAGPARLRSGPQLILPYQKRPAPGG